MGAAYFYQLKDSPLDVTLPMLVGKAREAGWRVLIRAVNPNLCARLDEVLWQGSEAAFLPHGVAGGPHDADQPILIGDAPATGFDCVICVDGAELTQAEVDGAERACVLFDGWDEAALSHARSQWKTLTDAGCAAQYWAQEDGRWAMKAQKS
ncbi:DNA polymerase III subunit chi [Yoonia sp. I 8.24]|uniref:DNA polymerase III subunit chi n=1 Tax=Yoonia sp. I 8.24 TaxID=1537229 RepID=UPI001EE0EE29|nr:DNA polymerase III subunit chi [Yoonia sp. I 8.24]MCG3266307.1 DNA polymerase III subunit chi [Yoonia sp. I 8.24]